jgi:hypothetical protein
MKLQTSVASNTGNCLFKFFGGVKGEVLPVDDYDDDGGARED